MQKAELQDSGSFGVKAAPQPAAGMQGGLDMLAGQDWAVPFLKGSYPELICLISLQGAV